MIYGSEIEQMRDKVERLKKDAENDRIAFATAEANLVYLTDELRSEFDLAPQELATELKRAKMEAEQLLAEATAKLEEALAHP